ncbi:MAG: hypothetical protein R3247_07780 [Rhodothermales bacterium]|nr:hypothetical protein [Rhodothermales bacterium]
MFVTRSTLQDFLTRLDAAYGRPGRVLLVGQTSLVYEGHAPWTDEAELTAEVEDPVAFDAALRRAAEAAGIAVWPESPADVIPLPEGYEDRHRAADAAGLQHLRLAHFDPYSVAYRFIARGDEPDYHLVLAYLDQGWVTFAEMDARLDALLPRFSMETIAQDPAEFMRRYKGLRQMAAAIAPGTLHRHTPA